MSIQIHYLSITSGVAVPAGLNTFNLILQQTAHPELDDPGMPGGDPDLPETPLDSGVFILVIIALMYGFWRIRTLKANPQ
jgi:hypothetical protein